LLPSSRRGSEGPDARLLPSDGLAYERLFVELYLPLFEFNLLWDGVLKLLKPAVIVKATRDLGYPESIAGVVDQLFQMPFKESVTPAL